MPGLTEQRVLKCAIDALNDYAALVGDDHEVGTCNCDLVNTANGLSALLAAAEGVERDAARLDWMARAGDVCIAIVVDAPHDGEYEVSHDLGDTGYGPTVRAAIDAAMRDSGEAT